jgi:RHS repeat-associated protein
VLSYYQKDGLGSTRALTNAVGGVTDRYTYDAFGRMIQQSGSTVNSYLFAGQQRDAATGLDYLRARYLNTASGRFISSDPFDGHLSLPITLNKFVYAGQNPVLNRDPMGKDFDLGSLTTALTISSLLFATDVATNVLLRKLAVRTTHWTATIDFASATIADMGLGEAFLTADSEVLPDRKSLHGVWLLYGLTVSTPLPGNASETSGTIETPGFADLFPGYGLSGPVTLGTLGGGFNPGTPSPNRSNSVEYGTIGLGYADFSGPFTGVDFSFGFFFGWSVLQSSYEIFH